MPVPKKTTRKKTTGTTRRTNTRKRKYTKRGLSGMSGIGDLGLNQVFSRSMYVLGGAVSSQFAHSIVKKFLINLGGDLANNTVITRAATLILAYLVAGYMQKENGQDFLLGSIAVNVNALLQEQGIYNFGQGTQGLNQLQQNQMRALPSGAGVGYNVFDEYLDGLGNAVNEDDLDLLDVLNGLGQNEEEFDLFEDVDGLAQQEDDSDIITDILLSNAEEGTDGLGNDEVSDFLKDDLSSLSGDEQDIATFLQS